MPKSIAGYNAESKNGKNAAIKYCQAWNNEIKEEGVALATDLVEKRIGRAMYNTKRNLLNLQIKDLNKCIASINSQYAQK